MIMDEIFEKTDFGQFIAERILVINKESEKINNMLKIEMTGYDKMKRTVTYEFPVSPWEANPNDVLHGGISATMMDLGLGLFANSVCLNTGGYFAPTVNMNINYLLPVPIGEKLVLKAMLVSSGASLLTLNGEMYIKGSDTPAITASAIYKVMRKR